MARKASRQLRSFRTLHGRVLAWTVIPVSLVLILVLSALELQTHQRQLSLLHQRVELTTEIASRTLAAALYHFDYETIEVTFETLLQDQDVVGVVAYDEGQASVMAWITSIDGELRSGEESLPGDIDLSPYEKCSRPIFHRTVSARKKIATIDIYYSEAAARSKLYQRLLVIAGVTTAVLAALLIFLKAGLRRAVLRPLVALKSSMRTGQSGGEYPLVELPGRDEVGELVREYNDMLAAEAAKKTEGQHRLSLYENSLDHVRHGFCVFDRDFRLMAYNKRYLELLGHEEENVELGMTLAEILKAAAEKGEYGDGSIDGLIIDRLSLAAGGEPYRRERERPDGSFIEIDSNPLPNGGFVSVYSDVTERKEYERTLRHMTLLDDLTQLPNRALFYDRLRQALKTAERLDHRLAVLMVDIDGFSMVNETQSRDVGDFVLQEVADRLRHLVRKSDTVARLENDVFAVIQQFITNVDEAAFLAHRILGSFSRPFETEEVALRLTASIGMTIYPDDDKSSKDILMHAHLAMHAAKAEGRNRYRYFVPEMDRAVAARRRLEEDLFTALRDQQFVLHYQPKVDLMTGDVVGAEALIRWQHPERGLLAPVEFIQLAEDRGLIVPLTDWILDETCRQIQIWQSRGLIPVPVSINLSPFHFQEGDVVESVNAALAKASVEHRMLAVEVTEKALLQNTDRVASSLRSLRDLGVSAVIDDFGTGYSSISSLHQFPIDTIKIDRRFVHAFGRDDEASTVVRAVIFLGRKLNLRVVAEGVEEEEQLRLLRQEGCNEVQGNYFSPPLNGEAFEAWVVNRDNEATGDTAA